MVAVSSGGCFGVGDDSTVGGVAVALNAGAERGMPLTCSMVGALLVMVAGLLGIITLLWVNGFGPPLGI